MIKVVIDTNVLVSGLHNEHGAEAAVLALIAAGQLVWCVSKSILAEYEETLHRPKFQYIQRARIDTLLQIARSGQMAIVTTALTVSEHESDNRFYECAHAAQADYLVTGNR